MEFKPSAVDLSMVPGDRINITVGIIAKCTLSIQSNGEVRIYYGEGKSLEI